MIRYYVKWAGGQWGPYNDFQLALNSAGLARQLRYTDVQVEAEENGIRWTTDAAAC